MSDPVFCDICGTQILYIGGRNLYCEYLNIWDNKDGQSFLIGELVVCPADFRLIELRGEDLDEYDWDSDDTLSALNSCVLKLKREYYNV